ncbi:protein phosphatase methylesterase [Linderina pennispora]|uniref:Protein phosphatase methylesterase 1 n=1 Tax=Linderina pennispora TaxID=61395 RepID=A0A1Y1WHQ3_9FUNG|nr:protein phosphatase methylesterase [Linderina pennispora]ORX72654.1 protein phosphatase methylesterase [Linderina pennispora]
MLHPLDWSSYFDSKQSIEVGNTAFNVYSCKHTNTGPIFILHHGAGHSGLTFGLLAKHLSANLPACSIVAMDCRGHGDTTGPHDDLSLAQLVNDQIAVFEEMFPGNARDVVLMGHSMGGAVAAHSAKRLQHVLGVALVDIVEGSAMDSLHAIPVFISMRPQSFASVEQAIAWHIDSGAIHSVESARLSVPSLVREIEPKKYPFWRGWYQGLSKAFVTAPAARLLVLAGTDRLDKELLIAQMQGKFQLEVLPSAGHTIQEDLPQQLAEILMAFWQRNQRLNIPVRRL